MEQTEKFANSKEVIAFLATTFPNCFSLEGEAKPLKIGIFQDLAEQLQDEQRISKTLLRSSLRHYTNSWRYLHSVKEGSHRVNLNGEKDEVISKEHADFAAEQLAESKKRAAQKRKEASGDTVKAKKSYNSRPKPDKKVSIKTANGGRNKVQQKPKPAPKLSAEHMQRGTRVTVKVGKAPMPATITEVAKDGIQVQLDSGMSVKVQSEQLRLAPSER